MNITWKRTIIGGETVAGDFVAEAEGLTIGRVRKIDGGPHKGKWEWSFLLDHSDFRRADLSRVEDDKQEAADKIRADFARYLEYPSDNGGCAGLRPEQMEARLECLRQDEGRVNWGETIDGYTTSRLGN